MEGRKYTAKVVETTITTQHDLLKIVAPSDAVVAIDKVKVTTLAAAAEAMRIQHGRATGGGTATTVTPEQDELSDAAFGGTVYDLTADTNGTITDMKDDDGLDVRAGYTWENSTGFFLPPSGIYIVRSERTLTTGVTMIVIVDFREIG